MNGGGGGQHCVKTPDMWNTGVSEKLTLKDERKLRVFENGMLRSIFGLKRGKIIWKWKKLQNEDLYALYS